MQTSAVMLLAIAGVLLGNPFSPAMTPLQKSKLGMNQLSTLRF